MGLSLSVTAQEGLQMNEVFEGKLIAKQNMQESLIKGDNLASYKLRLLHTAKFAANDAQRDKVEALFNEDMKERLSDDDSNMEMENRNGHIYYAIVQLSDKKDGTGRFICYQCREKQKDYDITLVYMEGSASLSHLREKFKRK